MSARPAAIVFLLSVATLGGCQKKPKHTIHVVYGTAADQQSSAVVESAYAEYVEVPGVSRTLTLTLASYEKPCGKFVSPGTGQVLASVIVGSPPDAPPTTGEYVWTGVAEGRYAMPSLRIAGRSYDFPPGGTITLTRVDLSPGGTVAGLLAFTFPGDDKGPPKSLTGSFEARVCSSSQR